MSPVLKGCANCMRYALAWRDRVLTTLDAPVQLDLDAWETSA